MAGLQSRPGGRCYGGDRLSPPKRSPAPSGSWGVFIGADAGSVDGISAPIEAARKRRQRMPGFREDTHGEACRSRAVAAFPRREKEPKRRC
jgi:hypothetical protein